MRGFAETAIDVDNISTVISIQLEEVDATMMTKSTSTSSQVKVSSFIF
jgi:hypothetical protein